MRPHHLHQTMHEVVPHIVPDPVVPQLHAVAVLRVQEVFVCVATRVAATAHVAAYWTSKENNNGLLQ